MKQTKKLIEVALPLVAINEEGSRRKRKAPLQAIRRHCARWSAATDRFAAARARESLRRWWTTLQHIRTCFRRRGEETRKGKTAGYSALSKI